MEKFDIALNDLGFRAERPCNAVLAQDNNRITAGVEKLGTALDETGFRAEAAVFQKRFLVEKGSQCSIPLCRNYLIIIEEEVKTLEGLLIGFLKLLGTLIPSRATL